MNLTRVLQNRGSLLRKLLKKSTIPLSLQVLVRCVLLFPLLVNLSSACSQEAKVDGITEILNRIDVNAITLGRMDRALPRLTDDAIILRLRGGDPLVLRGGNSRESNLKKCFVTTAYITAAIWDWSQFGVTQRSDSLFKPIKDAMELYLTHISQRLLSLGAREELVQRVNEMKYKLRPGLTERPDFDKTAEFLATLHKEIRTLALTRDQYELTFAMAEWFVWQAQLANLCLGQEEENAKYLREVMNQRYHRVKLARFAELSNELLGSKAKDDSEALRKSLEGLEDTFLLNKQKECETVQKEVSSIFKILDLTFPSLEVD